MFTCAIESTYTDPAQLDAEMKRHTDQAQKRFGECWMTGSMINQAPDHDAGVPTGSTTYKLTTTWQQGTKPK